MASLWSVVLAAGRGTRLAHVTGGVPKQFWAPTGKHSLLEDTVGRLAPIAPPDRTITIVDDTHHEYVQRLAEPAALGTIVYQPADRGTAVGVLLAATLVSTCDPAAIVVLTPADHGVGDEEAFRAGVRTAAAHVQQHPDDIVLLGVEPQSPAGDYGWIVTTPRPAGTMAAVSSFVEKPATAAAARLYESGALWNTMVLVARVEALLDLYRRQEPDLIGAFESFRFLPSAGRAESLRRLYAHLPVLDFSHDLLARATGLQCLAWAASMEWTDLGTPERLAAWLTRRLPARAGDADDRAAVTVH